MAHSQPNLILARLTAADFRLIESDLEDVDLPVHRMLERSKRRIDSVYFPDSGFASVVADGAGKAPIEVGVIGREGMTGLAVLLGTALPINETYIQVAGRGRRLKASVLRTAIDRHASLHRSMLSCVQAFLDQTAMTALANGRASIEDRLARWLLLADDRIDEAELRLTHEFLALMLGVRRPGVTVAAQALERDGLIARKRGSIVILDRPGLERMAGVTYAPAARN